MRLATRCPSCATLFLVVPDQLRVSDGWVRCGRCANVFNAAEDLLDVETGAAVQLDLSPPVPAPPAHWAADRTPDTVVDPAAAPPGEDLPLTPGDALQHGSDAPDALDAAMDQDWRQPPEHAGRPAPRGAAAPRGPYPPQDARRDLGFGAAYDDDLPEQLLRTPSVPDPTLAPEAWPDTSGRSGQAQSPWNMAPVRFGAPPQTPPSPPPPPLPLPPPPPAPPPAALTPLLPMADFGPGWLDDPVLDTGANALTRHSPLAEAAGTPPAPTLDAAPVAAPAAIAAPEHAPEPAAPQRWSDSGLPDLEVDMAAAADGGRPMPGDVDTDTPAPADAGPDSRHAPEEDGQGLPADDNSGAVDLDPWPDAHEPPHPGAEPEAAAERDPLAMAEVPAPQDDSARLAPTSAPSFLRQAEREARWQRSGWRTGFIGLALLLGGLLLGQAALLWRDTLAARLPTSAPLLQAACEPLGCSVQPLRRIEQLAVNSSGLKRVEEDPGPEGFRYRFNVLLHNRADTALLAPAMELTLSDARGDVVIRRVLQVADFGAAPQAIAAGQELPLRLLLSTGDRRIEGYTVELFYP